MIKADYTGVFEGRIMFIIIYIEYWLFNFYL